MKTSNKLIGGGLIFLFLSNLFILMSMKGAMEYKEGSYIKGNGVIEERVIGQLSTENLRLSDDIFYINPHSNVVTVKGDANIINAINELSNDIFNSERLAWNMDEEDQDKKTYIHTSKSQPLIYHIGVKDLNNLNIITGSNTVLLSSDTVTMDNIYINVEYGLDSLDLVVRTNYLNYNSIYGVQKSRLSGDANRMQVTLRASSLLDAQDLIADNASVSLDHRSTARLNVSNAITGSKKESATIENIGTGNLSVINSDF